MVHNLFFDLDNTLSSNNNRLVEAIQHNILQYLDRLFQIDRSQTWNIVQHYSYKYGSVLQGLIEEQKICAQSYLEQIHNIPAELLPGNDPHLQRLLRSLPCNKYVMTNSLKSYAQKVLESLGVLDQFIEIIDITEMNFKYKVDDGTILRMVKQRGLNPHNCALVDDTWENLQQAQKCGMKTILIHEDAGSFTSDYCFKNIYGLATIMKDGMNNE